MTIKVNAMGDACPLPVVKTQKAMQELTGAGTVETLVDNETAVQNLGKLAASKGCTSATEKLGENQYRVTITVGENAKTDEGSGECFTCGKPKTVVVLSSDKMGGGSDELGGAGVIETLVDNETAVQNLGKLAASRGCASKSEKLGEKQYRVTITVGENAKTDEASGECFTCGKPKTVAVISSDKMGGGSDELGGALMKAFVYALSQQETLPDTILCYNGGVKLSCEGSESLEDLKGMAERGVEILSCGTCLNYYDLKEKLAVGEVTNMYVIVEKMSGADRVVRP